MSFLGGRGGGSFLEEKELTSVVFTFPFCRLNPFTSYKLRLKATNDVGDSDFGAETDAVTTLQDGEDPI